MAERPIAVDTTFRDEISRAKLMDFVRDLGFDPEETISVLWESDEITVTTHHLHPEHGGRSTAQAGPGAPDGIVTVTTRIRVVG